MLQLTQSEAYQVFALLLQRIRAAYVFLRCCDSRTFYTSYKTASRLTDAYFVLSRLAILMTGRTSVIYQIKHINRNKLGKHAKMTLRETSQTNPDRRCHFSNGRLSPPSHPPTLHANSSSECLTNVSSTVQCVTYSLNTSRQETRHSCFECQTCSSLCGVNVLVSWFFLGVRRF